MYEIGEREPDFDTVTRLATFLNTSVDYLLGRTDDPRPVEEITDAHQRIEEALADDPEAEELLAFWKELKEREDLFLLFKQVRPLSDDSIRRVIRVIKAIEDEEAKEFGEGF
jgi:transcriptional regulator with XRE-family HTH domain